MRPLLVALAMLLPLAAGAVGNTLKIEDAEGVNFNTSVDWVKVEALSGQAGQLRWFFVGHSE
jgi:hypothetical protein